MQPLVTSAVVSSLPATFPPVFSGFQTPAHFQAHNSQMHEALHCQSANPLSN